MPTIGELQASLIEATQDPTAAIKVQAVADGLETLGSMLGGANLMKYEDVKALTDVMLGGWVEEEIAQISGSPEFILALTGMLRTALIHWISDNHKKMQEKRATKKPQ